MNPKWKKIVTRRVSIFRAFVMAEGSIQEMKKQRPLNPKLIDLSRLQQLSFRL